MVRISSAIFNALFHFFESNGNNERPDRTLVRRFGKLFNAEMMAGFMFLLFVLSQASVWGKTPLLNPEHPVRIPEMVDGRLIPRELGCWFPKGFETDQPEGYKAFIDAIGRKASFDMIAVSNRLVPYDSLSPQAVDFQRKAAVYAWEKYGIRMLPDAEIRLSRKIFKERYPNRLQEILVLREDRQTAGQNLEVSISQADRTDHYTHNYNYRIESVRLVRVWSYQKNRSGEIIPETIRDLTSEVNFSSERTERLYSTITLLPGETAHETRWICAAVSFHFLYPDLHSDEALSFEKEIFEAHKDLPAGGCVKDEWGFLPCYKGVPNGDEYYFSDPMAERYLKLTGRDLVSDFLLMYREQSNKTKERSQAIDDYNKMNLERCLEFEYQLYDLTKKFWGQNAFPATHPTWYPRPIAQEFKKNSLMWWRHPRDYAQTDEITPYPCRTGMAKTNGHLWYNEYYSDQIEPYFTEHWSDFLSGGRVNIHPFCCQPNNALRKPDNFAMLPILDQGAERVRQRIRMVSFISDRPLYCPVAVVFGHFGVMNWTRAEYNTVMTKAIPICSRFSNAGFPADLIPSSQINAVDIKGKNCWKLNKDGLLQYGIQPYKAIVFYAVTDSDRADFEKLTALNKNGKTKIIDPKQTDEIIAWLKTEQTPEQTPWKVRPSLSGFARLVDGTCLWANASETHPVGEDLLIDQSGIPVQDPALCLENRSSLKTGKPVKSAAVSVRAKAKGVLACRFDRNGDLVALAASELEYFSGGGIDLKISERSGEIRPDIALWKDASGSWKGIFQARKNELPPELKKFTGDWRFLQIQ